MFINVWIRTAELNEPIAYIALLTSRSSPPRADVGTSALSPAQLKEIADSVAEATKIRNTENADYKVASKDFKVSAVLLVLLLF